MPRAKKRRIAPVQSPMESAFVTPDPVNSAALGSAGSSGFLSNTVGHVFPGSVPVSDQGRTGPGGENFTVPPGSVVYVCKRRLDAIDDSDDEVDNEEDLEKRQKLGMKLPMMCSPKILKLIRARKYVSFAMLLNAKATDDSSLSLEHWLTAWNIFVSVHLIYFPEDGPSLPQHCEYVRDAAKISRNWESYDKNFRKKMARFPQDRKWNCKDQDLWNDDILSVPSSSFMPNPGVPVMGRTSNFPGNVKKVSKISGSNLGLDPYSSGVCKKFNFETCGYGNCRFKHVCGSCFPTNEQKHAAKNCPFSGTRK